MNFRVRGYEGVRQRMHEIESKLESLRGQRKQAAPLSVASGPARSGGFDKALVGALGNSGQGNSPLDPVAMGLVAVPADKGKLVELAKAAAARAGIDPVLFQALVQQESGFNPMAVSPVGAKGLTQLMPKTAAMLGVADPFDPVQNLDGGARYLAQMLKQFNGDPKLALAAYNAGPGAVTRAGGIPPYKETQDYVRRILGSIGG